MKWHQSKVLWLQSCVWQHTSFDARLIGLRGHCSPEQAWANRLQQAGSCSDCHSPVKQVESYCNVRIHCKFWLVWTKVSTLDLPSHSGPHKITVLDTTAFPLPAFQPPGLLSWTNSTYSEDWDPDSMWWYSWKDTCLGWRGCHSVLLLGGTA